MYKEYIVKVYQQGNRRWYYKGKLHREDGPAIECSDGHQEWYKDGQLHRADGPAVEFTDGTKHWYLNGKEYTEGEFSNFQNPYQPNDYTNKIVKVDGKKYKLVSLNEKYKA